MAENNQSGEAVAVSSKLQILIKYKKIIIALILLIIIIFAIIIKFLFPFSSNYLKNSEENTVPTVFLEIKDMSISLAGENVALASDRPRILKLRIALEVHDSKIAAQVQPLLPRVEDIFQIYLRELRVADLEGSASVFRLKEELLRRVNIAVFPSKVDAVLFREIAVQ